jgi:hypothetical protein
LRRRGVPWAGAARKTPTFLGRTLRRLEVRIGGKRAAVAVGRILVSVYHLLVEGTAYEAQRYADPPPKQEERERKRAIKTRERLGYGVTVDRVASSLGTTLRSSCTGCGASPLHQETAGTGVVRLLGVRNFVGTTKVGKSYLRGRSIMLESPSRHARAS